MKLNIKKIYDLSELTRDELKDLFNWMLQNDTRWEGVNFVYWAEECKYKKYNLIYNKHWYMDDVEHNTNAKELFYTLENIQVDCSNETEERIKEMADVFENAGYKVDRNRINASEHTFIFLRIDGEDVWCSDESKYKTTITYNKFMELFADTEQTISDKFLECEELFIKGFEEMAKSLQPHYDNTNGSIYKFCNDQKLNSWEFDIINHVVECRKKGLFKEDLQKTKDLIDLYLKEWK